MMGLKATKMRMEDRYMDTLIANWTIWLPAAGLMFAAIPTKHQVFLLKACTLHNPNPETTYFNRWCLLQV